MLKTFLALAATVLFSLNASAAVIEYRFNSGAIKGGFIQNDADKSIIDYSVSVQSLNVFGAGFQASGMYGSITGVSTNFANAGPTNFAAFDRRSEVYVTNISFNFYGTDTAGVYLYDARYTQMPDYANYPVGPGITPLTPLATTFWGYVTANPYWSDNVDTYLVNGQRVYGSGLPVMIPQLNQVPEPGSLGLLALGALALASRRKKRSVR